MSLQSRVKTLERPKRAIAAAPFRVIVSHAGKRFDLATATCERTLCSDGSLLEIVKFGGSGRELTGEDLERFIASFPIET